MGKGIEKLKSFYEKRGVLGVVELLFHPFLTPLFLIPAWCKSLWNSRVLLYGQWSRYHGFHPRNTINCFFYKTQWLNFERYGRCGISPVVGLGNYPLSKWLHLTMFSSCLYANAGAVVTLGGTLIWVFSHLVWLSEAPWQWVVAVTMLLFFSSTAYAMAFVRQNYNILGWMWLPVGLYAIATQQYALAAFMWLLVSFASFTAVVTVAIMLFFMTIFERNLYIGLTVVPAVLKLCLHLLPLLHTGGMKSAIVNMSKLIGLTSSKGVRYKRTSMRLSLFTVYFLCLCAAGCIFLWIGTKVFPLYPVLAMLIFALNQTTLRFADEQSCIIFFVITYVATLFQNPFNLFSLLSLLIISNPHCLFLGLSSLYKAKSTLSPNVAKPFDHTDIIGGFRVFLASAKKGSKVLFSFDNPGDTYENIFDGYRVALEAILFVAQEKEVYLFPDWYFIAETNFKGSPDCWGNTPKLALQNMHKWQAGYAIIYASHNASLDTSWFDDFEILAEFNWKDWEYLFEGSELPWERTKITPKWHLVSLKNKHAFQ